MAHRFPSAVTARSLLSNIRLRYLGMGVFWACSMLTFRSGGLLPDGVDVALYSTGLLLISFGVNIVTMLLLSLMELRRPGTVDGLSAGSFVALIIMGFSCLYLSEVGSVHFELFFGGAVMVGVGYGYFWGIWAQVYSRMHQDVTTVVLPLNFVEAGLIYFLVSAIESAGVPAAYAMIPLPPISWVMLSLCRLDGNYEEDPGSNRNFTESVMSLGDLLVACGVLSFMFGLLWELSLQVLESVELAHRLPLLFAIATTFVLLLVVTFGRKRWSIEMLYRYGCPVIAIAFVLIPLAFMTNTVLVASVMGAGFSILEVLVWIASTSIAYDNRASGFVVGAIARTTFLAARLAGVAFGWLLAAFNVGGTIPYAVIAVSGILALGAAILYWSHGAQDGEAEGELDVPDEVAEDAEDAEGRAESPSAEGGGSPIVPPDLPIYQFCIVVAERHNLSRRESEILPYLAMGRSAKYISDQLYISENTVRTHIRHIVEKTGAGAKSNILDVVMREGRGA